MNSEIKILVIDDEVQIRRLLRITLESVGWKVYESADGNAGLKETAFIRPDCILLDLGLPDLSGIEVLTRLREWSQVPVLILSVRDEPAEKVKGLESGADDYLTKPFDGKELLARCRNIMRRKEERKEIPLFSQGSFRMDFATRQVHIRNSELDLSATEYELLRLLVQHAGRVQTHAQLLRTIWGPKAEEQRQYLRVYMTALRKKLGTHVEIKTEPGIGYRLLIDQSE